MIIVETRRDGSKVVYDGVSGKECELGDETLIEAPIPPLWRWFRVGIGVHDSDVNMAWLSVFVEEDLGVVNLYRKDGYYAALVNVPEIVPRYLTERNKSFRRLLGEITLTLNKAYLKMT